MPIPIREPFQIVCEGRDDADFYFRLLRDRQIEGYDVAFGEGRDGRPLGKDGFAKRIESVLNFFTVPIEGIVIIADTDDDPKNRFKDASHSFSGHQGFSLPIPKAAMQVTLPTDPQTIKTGVIMIPEATVGGGLESLALNCCSQIQTHIACIDAFCQCVPSAPRAIDRDKLRLRALIAAHSPDDPSRSLGTWFATENRPFPMTHTALDAIAQFLIDFKTA